LGWIHLAQDRDQWRAVVNRVMKLLASEEGLCSIGHKVLTLTMILC